MKIQVIINPKSKNGNNYSLVSTLWKKFSHCLVDIQQTYYPKHATDIARKAVKENVDTLVVVGGDGTVNEVLNGIAGTDVALGIIPAGTANDLASHYHIPADAIKACDIILERCVHRTDVICVNGMCYITGGGIGLPCEVANIANRIKRNGRIGRLLVKMLGSNLYILSVLITLMQKCTQQKLLFIKSNGSFFMVDTLSLMVDNQSFLGKNFLMSPGAVNDDGIFDICLIENSKSRMQILLILMKVLTGKHIHFPSVWTWRAGELVVYSQKPLMYFGDGEIFEEGLEFKIKIFPRALNVIVPKAFLESQQDLVRSAAREHVPCS